MYLYAAFTLGLLGSLHCIGMCGPIALSLPVTNRTFAGILMSSISYNTGRIITYSLIGVLFGLAGKTFSLAGIQNAVSVALGCMILLFMVAPSLARRGKRMVQVPGLGKIQSALGQLLKKRSLKSLFAIGLLNGLLPCGLVYLGITGAIAGGSVITGMLFMAAFGAGTFPAMTFLAFSSRYVPDSVRLKLQKAVPVFISAMAVILILRGMNLGIPYISPSIETCGEMTVQSCCSR
jgi:sulfite exporter TauE/SafE